MSLLQSQHSDPTDGILPLIGPAAPRVVRPASRAMRADGPPLDLAASSAALPGVPVAVVGPVPVLFTDGATVVDAVGRAIEERRQPLHLAFCNAHTMVLAHDDPSYAAALCRLTVLNDGVGMNLAARLIAGAPFPENLNGTDFVPRLLHDIVRPLRIFLLGARPEVVGLAAEAIARDHPRHSVVGYRDGFFGPADAAGIVADINASKPDLLLVAMGNPRQERFVADHLAALDVPVSIGVGALFDFMAGVVPRAPRAIRAIGMEWCFRLMLEPRRLMRRYTVEVAEFLAQTLRFRARHGRIRPGVPGERKG